MDFTDNIITRTEFRHQRYVIENSRSGRAWIILAVLMLIPALLASFSLFGLALLNISFDALTLPAWGTLITLAQVGIAALITMNIAQYLVVIFITLGLSSNSIIREHRSKNWDILVLTNVDARQLVWGKWWASLRALWGDHVMLALLRLGIMALLVTNVDDLPPGILGMPPHLTHLLALTTLMLLLTALDAAFTTALGVALPLSNWPGAVVGGIVMSVRLMLVLVLFAFMVVLWLALVDGQPYLLYGLVGALLFAGAITLTLRAAEFIAARGQVSH